ncbi:MAG: hypothetical protein QM682_10285 [Paracoccus sp. (in: a-proteobacteria)]|uniref:hypothetical protein n=1 Tax=Paracoccus sp. TaxID=267 RepID=UPI0039E39246
MSSHHSDRRDPDPQGDLGVTRTDADVLSETRFGPRPVPQGHRPPHGPHESRRIPPSGDVSPDGSRSYPRPSRLAKWIVWGGTGIAAAALTAGTVYAARHVADLLDGDKSPAGGPRPAKPPHMPAEAARDDRPPRQGARQDAQDRAARFAAPSADEPRARPRRRAPRRNLMQEIEQNTQSLSQGVDSVMRSVNHAVTGFGGVAGQAAQIVREFGDVAVLIRELMGNSQDRRPEPAARQGFGTRPPGPAHGEVHPDNRAPDDRHGAHMPDLHGDAAAHDPAKDSIARDFDPRSHRL